MLVGDAGVPTTTARVQRADIVTIEDGDDTGDGERRCGIDLRTRPAAIVLPTGTP